MSVQLQAIEVIVDALTAARQRIVFLEEQIRIEQAAQRTDAAKYAIIEARYKQVEERWHKLMGRRELQCNNRIINHDMQGGGGAS